MRRTEPNDCIPSFSNRVTQPRHRGAGNPVPRRRSRSSCTSTSAAAVSETAQRVRRELAASAASSRTLNLVDRFGPFTLVLPGSPAARRRPARLEAEDYGRTVAGTGGRRCRTPIGRKRSNVGAACRRRSGAGAIRRRFPATSPTPWPWKANPWTRPGFGNDSPAAFGHPLHRDGDQTLLLCPLQRHRVEVRGHTSKNTVSCGPWRAMSKR